MPGLALNKPVTSSDAPPGQSTDLLHATPVATRQSSADDLFLVKAEAAVSEVSSASGTVHVLDIRLEGLMIHERDRLADLVKSLQWSVDCEAPVVSLQLVLLDKCFAEVYCRKLQGKMRFDRVLNLLEALDQHHFWASHEMPQDLYEMTAATVS